jgi:hypothetical protein
MNASKGRIPTIAFRSASVAVIFLAPVCSFVTVCSATPSGVPAEQAAAPGAVGRHIGAIKSINGSAITLTQDSGPDLSVTIAPTTRIVRIAPGEKDLKNATPVALQDLQVGDRILVAGKDANAGDNQSLVASTVVVMKSSDVQTLHQQELQDWQKRGVDGIASAVDLAAGTVTISARGKKVVVQVSKSTVIRRYAPDSVKFEDAKPSTFQELHPGDQVRARGERSADGGELTAEEIVSGSFPSVAGTVNSVNASESTLNVQDLLAKKTVVVKITPDSQLRSLPPEMAQRIAMFLKGAAAGATPGTSRSGPAADGQNPSPASPPGGMPPSGLPPGGGMGARPGGGADFQRLLARAPAISLADLHKGDAVLILSTSGSTGVGTVITLLSGVEPILRAAPGASSVSILTPWSLSAPSGDAGGP